ncbi:hypothetical protein V8G54_031994 [Vigna mungo]|uniref:Uncharacterized protein n=1 Tax=Vigna mungo TaxID=3915 RepID=A0AAQ3RGA6_VIGMU
MLKQKTIPRLGRGSRQNLKSEKNYQPIFSVFVSSEGHITVSISRSLINSKFSSEISLYISAWSHFCTNNASKLKYIIPSLLYIYIEKESIQFYYLDPFTIKMKPS